MSDRAPAAKNAWLKLVVALLCAALAGTFIYFRVRGPAPARLDPAVEAAGGLMGRRTARQTDGARPAMEHADNGAQHVSVPGAPP